MPTEEQALRYKAAHAAEKLTIGEVRRYLALGKEEQMVGSYDVSCDQCLERGSAARMDLKDGVCIYCRNEAEDHEVEAPTPGKRRLATAVRNLAAVKEAIEWLEALCQERQFDAELVEVLTATIEVLRQVRGVKEGQ